MQPTDESYLKAKQLLDANHTWPGPYVFKFIVPVDERKSLINLVGDHTLQKENPSKTGKYTSLTISKHFKSSDEVMKMYQEAKGIPGLISL